LATSTFRRKYMQENSQKELTIASNHARDGKEGVDDKRRYSTNDFRNLFSFSRHGKYKQVSLRLCLTRRNFVARVFFCSMHCLFIR
jgi:hypothetical protein